MPFFGQKPRFIELSCKPDGSILKERVLRAEPAKAIYDEVWTNDEGKKSLDTCARMSRQATCGIARASPNVR